MTSPAGLPDMEVLEQLSQGFMVSQVLFAACELRVFDALAEAPGPLGAEAVAARLGTSPRATELLMDVCVSLGLLRADVRAGGALYDNTELSSTYLVSSSPSSQCNMMLYLGKTTYVCWAHLAQAVREGKNQYLKAFGVPSDQLFSAIYRSDEERLRFMAALQDVWSVQGRDVLSAFDLSPFPRICDLGGCSGALARQCAALHPGCRVTVFDLPEVVRAAQTHFLPPQDGRIHFQQGDFFEDPLPEADLYILARVLHDWPDDKCSRLLARIYAACKPGGAALVVERLLAADGRGPRAAQLLSLTLLVQAEGQARRPARLRALLAAAGFRRVRCWRPPAGGAHGALLATK